MKHLLAAFAMFTLATPAYSTSFGYRVEINGLQALNLPTINNDFRAPVIPNSALTVSFSNGRALTQILPDGYAPSDSYVLSQSVGDGEMAQPEPDALATAGAGLAVLVLLAGTKIPQRPKVGLLTLVLAAGSAYASDNAKLFEAIQAGDRAQIERALATADVNAKDSDGTPALMNAVLFCDLATVRLLIDRGADVNATNPVGATALLWAAGDKAKANLLMDRGANPNIKTALGRTPLLAAAPIAGNGPTVARMLKAGADPTAKDELTGIPVIFTGAGKAPAIIEAAKARDGAALKQLIAQGTDVNAKDNNGGTAFSEAVILGNIENVKTLLATKKVDLETGVGMYKVRPLMFAAIRRDAAMTKLLLDAGANPNARDAFGASVLMWAAYGAEASDASVVKMLLAAGADTSVKNKQGESAITWAQWHGKDTPASKALQIQ